MADDISSPLLALIKDQGMIDDLQYEEIVAEIKRTVRSASTAHISQPSPAKSGSVATSTADVLRRTPIPHSFSVHVRETGVLSPREPSSDLCGDSLTTLIPPTQCRTSPC